MDSTIPSAMTQEGSDNSAETKPPRSWSWLWFRPIQLQGLTTSERRVIRREMRFGPKQIAWTASSIALVGFISGLSIAVVILKLDDPGFPMVIFKGVLSLVFVSCGWFFLAICFVFRLLTVLMIMNVRVCDSCGQRAQ